MLSLWCYGVRSNNGEKHSVRRRSVPCRERDANQSPFLMLLLATAAWCAATSHRACFSLLYRNSPRDGSSPGQLLAHPPRSAAQAGDHNWTAATQNRRTPSDGMRIGHSHRVKAPWLRVLWLAALFALPCARAVTLILGGCAPVKSHYSPLLFVLPALLIEAVLAARP